MGGWETVSIVQRRAMIKGGIYHSCAGEPIRNMGAIDGMEYRNKAPKAKIEDGFRR